MYLLIKPASGACNLRCKYCFYADEMANRCEKIRPMMTAETFRVIMEKAALHLEKTNDPQLSVGFQGGEPMLAGLDFFRHAIHAVNELIPENITVSFFLQTNGTLITREWAEFFRENRFLIGVSMDGTASLHNKNRVDASGKGSHRAVGRGIAALRAAGCDFNVLTVLTRDNADRAREMHAFFAGQNITWEQYIPCIAPFDGSEHSFTLNAESYGKFLSESFDIWYEGFTNGKPVRNREIDNFFMILLGYPPEDCGMAGICSVQYLIESDGSVYPCDFYALDEYFLGNILEEDFDAIDKKRTEIGFIESSCNLHDECKSCRYLPLCRGGCRRNRDGNGKNRFCEGYKIFFEYALPRMEELAYKIKNTKI